MDIVFNPKVIITRKLVDELYVGFEHFFPDSGSFINSQIANWKTRQEFIDYIKTITGVDISKYSLKEIKEVEAKFEEKLSELDKQEKTTQNEEQSAISEEELKHREASKAEADKSAKEAVEKALEQKRKIIVSTNEKLKTVSLTPQEKEKIFKLAQAIKTDQGTAQKIIEEKIQSSVDKSSIDVKENISPTVIKKTTSDVIEKIKPFSEYKKAEDIPSAIPTINTASPIIAITNPNDPELIKIIPSREIREQLTQNASNVALAIDAERKLNSIITAPLFENSDNLSTLFYPDGITNFQVSSSQDPGYTDENSVELDIKNIYDQGKDIWDIWQKIANKTTTVDEVISSTTSIVPSYSISTSTATVNTATSMAVATLPSTIGAITVGAAGFGMSTLSTWALATQTRLLTGQGIAGLITSGGIESLAMSSSGVMANTLINIELGNVAFRMINFSQGAKSLYTAGLVVQGKGAIGLALAKVPGAALPGTFAINATGQITTKALPAVLSKVFGFLASVGPVVGTLIGTGVGWVVGKIIEKIPWDKVKKAMPYVAGLLVGIPGLLIGGPTVGILLGLGTTAGILATGGALTLGGLATGIGGFFAALGGAVFATIGLPVLITILSFPVLIALILFIINSGAYVVPYSSERSIPPGVGGLVSNCIQSEMTGVDITNELASRIRSGSVNLLPNTVWGRRDGICITPTMIIVHWSAGPNDDPAGNQKTYNMLVQRGLSCQLATDTDDTILMEKFFEKQVEFPACAGEWNTYSINNEVAGTYFTNSPPPPNTNELELAYDATCKIMSQYDIPWSQIYGHYQVPNSGGKIDPGKEFLEQVFIPEIKRRCPNG